MLDAIGYVRQCIICDECRGLVRDGELVGFYGCAQFDINACNNDRYRRAPHRAGRSCIGDDGPDEGNDQREGRQNQHSTDHTVPNTPRPQSGNTKPHGEGQPSPRLAKSTQMAARRKR